MTPFTGAQLLDALQVAIDEADRRSSPSAICLVDDGGHVLVYMRHPSGAANAVWRAVPLA